MGWSPALPGQAATRLALIFLPRRSWPSGWGCYMSSVPKAVRVVVLVNPTNAPSAELTLRSVRKAARALGLQIQVLHASTRSEIEAAFATLTRDRADALFVSAEMASLTADAFNLRRSRRAMGFPRPMPSREIVEVGGLMSYGTDSSGYVSVRSGLCWPHP